MKQTPDYNSLAYHTTQWIPSFTSTKVNIWETFTVEIYAEKRHQVKILPNVLHYSSLFYIIRIFTFNSSKETDNKTWGHTL